MKQIGPLYFPDHDTHFQQFEDEYGGVVNYQKPQRDYAMSFVKDFGVAMDVGGHVGIFSRHFAERFEKVITFEPVEGLRQCIALNVPGNVEIRPEAISDHSGVTMLHTPSNGNSGNAFLSDEQNNSVAVNVIRIDDLNLPSLGLLKIDIQGEDYKALVGAIRTIKRCRTVVLIEEKPIGGPDGPVDHIAKIAKLMESINFTRRDLVGADRIYTFG